MALSMALLLSVKSQKSDEWLIVHNETSVIWAVANKLKWSNTGFTLRL